MRFHTMTAFAAAMFLFAGCGPNPGKSIKVDGGNAHVTVSGDNTTVTVKSDDGKTTVQYNANGMGNAQLPDFAPLYPGAKVQGSVTANSSEGGTVAFETTAKPDDVIAFYKQKSAAAGLTQKLDMNANGNVTFMASQNDDKKTVQVVAAKTDDGTHVQIFWQNKN
ncbi:MAG: hypothetical protein ACREHE_07625 [Rhizomicrobium sp.]